MKLFGILRRTFPRHHRVVEEHYAVPGVVTAHPELKCMKGKVAILREFLGDYVHSFGVIDEHVVVFCPVGILLHEVLDRVDWVNLVPIDVESRGERCPGV